MFASICTIIFALLFVFWPRDTWLMFAMKTDLFAMTLWSLILALIFWGVLATPAV